MDNDKTLQEILIELRMIRRAVRSLLFVVACGVFLTLFVINPEATIEVAFPVAAVLAIIAIAASGGSASAKAINRIKDR